MSPPIAPQGRDRLRIAIQKSGRLAEPARALLASCGLSWRESRDRLFCYGETLPVDLLLVRDDDIPGLIADGVCDLGVVGRNVLQEQGQDRVESGRTHAYREWRALGFGGCRLDIAVPDAWDWQGPQQLEGKRIATSYPALLRQWLRNQGIAADVVLLSGSEPARVRAESDRLIAWGVPAAKVQQFDWWQGTTIAGVKLVATPAQHFSGRSLSDGNRTLWASWVIEAGQGADATRIFFSGDTGYFDGFKAIGERFGPFDLTLIETGAYDAQWPDVHMQPEESLQAHLDVKGRHLMPIHNGTFDLALHAWTDPFDRITALAEKAHVPLVAPVMGERLDIRQPALSKQWWKGPQPQARPAVMTEGQGVAARVPAQS